VVDVTHDTAEEGFHEIHLSGKQLVFLFMATTVVSVVIFLCGVQVGRGVPLERSQEPLAANPTPIASVAPTTPPPAAEAPPAAEPPPPPAETAEDLSYKKRLEAEAPPAERLKPVDKPAAREPRQQAAPPAPAGPKTVAGAAQPGTWVLQVHALRDAKVANGIVQRLAKKGYPAFLVESGAPTSMYRVFVGRYKERDEAERVAARLKKEEQFNPWITR
jgi:cell division protein FtsN